MQRRSSLFVAYAAFALAACASAPPRDAARVSVRGFVSDRISVVTRGSGPDVILIPGLAAHRDVWAGAAETLDDRYRLHLVQVNGFAGFAPGANADGPVAAPVAEEVARYIREAGLSRPAVIGHSMGGTMGMMLAARHPDHVGRLMVVDAVPFLGVAFGPAGTTPESVRPFADQIRDSVLAQRAGSSPTMLEQMVASMTRTEALRPVLLRYARDSDRRTVANAFHEGIVTDLRAELARIAAPMTVLYVVPPNVPLSPEEFDRAIRLSFANAPRTRFMKIDDSNHYIQIDQPARFAGEVDAFMRRETAARSAAGVRLLQSAATKRTLPTAALDYASGALSLPTSGSAASAPRYL
jgi:pimeloyl-ACP methyl ester carboxylesterase